MQLNYLFALDLGGKTRRGIFFFFPHGATSGSSITPRPYVIQPHSFAFGRTSLPFFFGTPTPARQLRVCARFVIPSDISQFMSRRLPVEGGGESTERWSSDPRLRFPASPWVHFCLRGPNVLTFLLFFFNGPNGCYWKTRVKPAGAELLTAGCSVSSGTFAWNSSSSYTSFELHPALQKHEQVFDYYYIRHETTSLCFSICLSLNNEFCLTFVVFW